MIVTKYNLNIEIDGKNYSIVYIPLSNKNRKILDSKQNEIVKKNKELDAKKNSLKFKKEEFVLNNEILKSVENSEKLELLKEQKKLKKEIYDLELEIPKDAQTITPVASDIEDIQKIYFDMCIAGDDAKKLKALVEASDVSYDQAVLEIEKLAKEESEKK